MVFDGIIFLFGDDSMVFDNQTHFIVEIDEKLAFIVAIEERKTAMSFQVPATNH